MTGNLEGLPCEHSDGNSCELCNHDYELRNLVDDKSSKKFTSTNRIFRIYEGFGSDLPKLRYRFDWQIDLDKKYVNYDVFKDIKEVEAIVIVDHGKGVVTDEIIDLLLNSESFKNTKWYVRTKLKSPSWFKKINEKEKKLRLLVADQQLINHVYGERMWTRSTSLCRASLELLGNMLGLKTYEHGNPLESDLISSENTAVLFEENWAIAGSRYKDSKQDSDSEDKARIYYLPKSSDEAASIRVGRTSIFFNSLIYRDLMNNELNESTMPIATEWALQNMNKWMETCTAAWKDENPSALSGPFEDVISWNQNVKEGKDIRPGFIEEDYYESWRNGIIHQAPWGCYPTRQIMMKNRKKY